MKLTEEELQAQLEAIAAMPSASMMRAELGALVKGMGPATFVAFDVDQPRRGFRAWFSGVDADHLFVEVDAGSTTLLLHPSDVARLRGWLNRMGAK